MLRARFEKETEGERESWLLGLAVFAQGPREALVSKQARWIQVVGLLATAFAWSLRWEIV